MNLDLNKYPSLQRWGRAVISTMDEFQWGYDETTAYLFWKLSDDEMQALQREMNACKDEGYTGDDFVTALRASMGEQP